MLAEVVHPSSPSPSPAMASAFCGGFLVVEFLIFFVVFLAGFASNLLFVLVSSKELAKAKGSSVQIYNNHLVHYSIANIILLIIMPLDIISFTSGSWFFGEHFCRLQIFGERALCVTMATHTLNMARDVFAPFGFSPRPFSFSSTWVISLVFMFPMIISAGVKETPDGCSQCTLMEYSLGRLWMFQWSEQVYVAIMPLIMVWFYNNKYHEHPDYEAVEKAGSDDVGGHFKMNFRAICFALAGTLFLCTSPARLTEISGGNFKLWPGHQLIFFFFPRLLIYGQTIIFTAVCAQYYPGFYEGAKIAAGRIWSGRNMPEKFFIEQEEHKKELLN